jgi:FtsH-binding integral membrane protein
MAHLDAASRTETVQDASLRKYFSNVFLVMAVGLAITGLTALWISHDVAMMSSLFHLHQVVDANGKAKSVIAASPWWWASVALQFGLVLVMAGGRLSRVGKSVGYVTFGFYALLSGITLAPVLYSYTDASAAKVFLITAATFGGSALWGHTTKTNLTQYGAFFRMALIGMIVALVVNFFFSSPAIDFIVSIVGVLLFAGLTAYDMQKLEQLYDNMGGGDDLVVYGALSLYLDFLNLFLFLLRIFGVKKD